MFEQHPPDVVASTQIFQGHQTHTEATWATSRWPGFSVQAIHFASFCHYENKDLTLFAKRLNNYLKSKWKIGLLQHKLMV